MRAGCRRAGPVRPSPPRVAPLAGCLAAGTPPVSSPATTSTASFRRSAMAASKPRRTSLGAMSTASGRPCLSIQPRKYQGSSSWRLSQRPLSPPRSLAAARIASAASGRGPWCGTSSSHNAIAPSGSSRVPRGGRADARGEVVEEPGRVRVELPPALSSRYGAARCGPSVRFSTRVHPTCPPFTVALPRTLFTARWAKKASYSSCSCRTSVNAVISLSSATATASRSARSGSRSVGTGLPRSSPR